MDPFALVGIVAVVGSLGYIAAAQKYARRIRHMQQHIFSANVESITRMAKAAIQTLTEDYGHPEAEAKQKLFARCKEHGMQLMHVDSKTGKSEAVSP